MYVCMLSSSAKNNQLLKKLNKSISQSIGYSTYQVFQPIHINKNDLLINVHIQMYV